jgi:hypothetical protein
MSTTKELVKKGLTDDEAKVLAKWIEEGKPGLTKYKAEHLGEVYCLGYDCKDIQRWFPEYPLPVLLWARVTYNWDETRNLYRKVIQQETLNAAVAARMESIRFLTDALTATHIKYRKEILQYVADPDNREPPKKIIPDNIHSYGFMINLLKEMMAPSQDKNMTDKAMPLVTVNVSGSGDKSEINVSQASQDDIKKALMEHEKK